MLIQSKYLSLLNGMVYTLKEQQLTALNKKKSLPRKDGPFVKHADAALASFNVHRQAYYSGTFVGNHVHRALKVQYLTYNASDIL